MNQWVTAHTVARVDADLAGANQKLQQLLPLLAPAAESHCPKRDRRDLYEMRCNSM